MKALKILAICLLLGGTACSDSVSDLTASVDLLSKTIDCHSQMTTALFHLVVVEDKIIKDIVNGQVNIDYINSEIDEANRIKEKELKPAETCMDKLPQAKEQR